MQRALAFAVPRSCSVVGAYHCCTRNRRFGSLPRQLSRMECTFHGNLISTLNYSLRHSWDKTNLVPSTVLYCLCSAPEAGKRHQLKFVL